MNGLNVLEDDKYTQSGRGRYVLAFMGVSLLAAALVSAVVSLPLALSINKVAATSLNAWVEIDPIVADPILPEASVMLTKQGTVIARFAKYDREVVEMSQISPLVVDALVATEDSRFFEHNGVDVKGLGRALINNAQSDSLQGGSTITQQYIKNVGLLKAELSGDIDIVTEATERTLGRKVSEARKAIALEKQLSKEDILTRYLNIVNFGSGAYGIQAAAQRYFSIDAVELDALQAATLVGIVNRPGDYSPLVNTELSTNRRNHVLGRMVSEGYLSPGEGELLKDSPMVLDPTEPGRGCGAAKPSWGHYCQVVLDEMLSGDYLSTDPLEREIIWDRGGLTVVTELDEEVQASAQEAVKANVPSKSRVAGMIAVVQPGTGSVAALASNKTYGRENNQTQVPLLNKPFIGPGSTMKMFTVAAAAAAGIDLNNRLPGGIRYASPVSKNPESGSFNNYSTAAASDVTVVEAVRRSLNTAMIQLSEQVGIKNVAELAYQLGAKSLPITGEGAVGEDEGSLTLGAREIPVVEMANSYASIAAEGLACEQMYVSSISYAGQVQSFDPECTQVLSPAAARAVTATLVNAVESGTGTSAKLDGRVVAGKTGTSQDISAAWFAGFTPQWAAAAALADPTGPLAKPLVDVLGYSKVYGGTLPAAVFKETMNSIHQGLDPAFMSGQLDGEYLLGVLPSSKVVIPWVAGMDAETARRSLTAAGLNPVGEVANTVLGTTPLAGTLVEYGSDVQIVG